MRRFLNDHGHSEIGGGLSQEVQIGVLKLLKRISFVGLFFVFPIHSALLGLFSFDPKKVQEARFILVSAYSRLALWCLDMRVVVHGLHGIKDRPYLLVANHLSYVDVLVIASTWPSRFITSVEVEKSGFLGAMARLGSCLFVERRSRDNIEKEKEKIAEVLNQGHSVVLFPEGTSSDGSQILPFKAAFFDCARMAEVPILPVYLDYVKIDGRPATFLSKDSILYYGDHQFSSQFFKLLNLNSTEVHLEFSNPIECNQTADPRRELANKTREQLVGIQRKLRGHDLFYGDGPAPISRASL